MPFRPHSRSPTSHPHQNQPSLPGLANLGNTCFMNSILQSLNATRPLASFLLNNSHIDPDSNSSNQTHPLLLRHSHPTFLSSPDSSHLPILLGLSQLFRQLSTSIGALRPSGLLNTIAARHPDYRLNEQQDAHEFLRILLDLIRSEEAAFIKHCSDSSSSTSGSVTSCSASSVHDSTSAHQSHACSDTPVCQEPTPTTSSSSSSLPECALLDSLFSGSLTQFTVCERFHVSSVPEAFLDLSLATRHSDTTTTKRSRFRQELERRLKSKSPSSPSATPSDHWDQVLLGGSSVATLPTGTREKSTLFQSTRRCPPALLPSHSSTGLIRRASCGASSQFHSEPPSRAAAEPALLAHILSPTRLKAPPTSAPVFSTTSAPGMAPGGLRALRFAQPNPIFARVGLGSSLPPTVGETGLEDLLRSFTAVERLEGENRFACEACGADEEASLSSQPMTEKTDEAESTTKKCSKEPAVVLRRAWRRYMITTLPPVVVVHLKRFERANSDGPQPFISFPLKLDFGPYLCPTASRRDKATDEQGRIYGLYAVVVHRGLSVGGHYFAYVLSDRNGPPGGGVKGGVDGIERSWLYCSDVEVRKAKLEEVLKSKAYMLFYERL